MEGGDANWKHWKTYVNCLIEYDTPKVVTVRNVPLGILRIVVHLIVITFIFAYQMWYVRGYQEFTGIESSVTTKVKGSST